MKLVSKWIDRIFTHFYTMVSLPKLYIILGKLSWAVITQIAQWQKNLICVAVE
jgi:hypothetical protein